VLKFVFDGFAGAMGEVTTVFVFGHQRVFLAAFFFDTDPTESVCREN
jgi:hypothetical protein